MSGSPFDTDHVEKEMTYVFFGERATRGIIATYTCCSINGFFSSS